MKINIQRPQQKDFDELKELFTSVITNNFKSYGFYDKYRKDIDYEVNKQITAINNVLEIKSAYVLPEYQGKGIGTFLLNEIIKKLQEHGFKEFVLESGYPNAQQFWKKKLEEEPVKIVNNRWGAGNDYMIWHKKLS